MGNRSNINLVGNTTQAQNIGDVIYIWSEGGSSYTSLGTW